MRLNKKDRALLRRIINFIIANKKKISNCGGDTPISGMCLIPVFLQKRKVSARFSSFSQLDYPDGKVFLKGDKDRFKKIIKAYKPKKVYNEVFYFKPYDWSKRIEFLEGILNED